MFCENIMSILSRCIRLSMYGCLTLLSSWALSSHAQQGASYKQLLQEVETHQQQFTPWQTQDEILSLQQQQNKLLKNPTLTVEQKGFTQGQDHEFTMTFKQPLDIFGERKAKQSMLEIEKSALELQQQTYQAQLGLIVKYAWSQAMLAQLELHIIQQQLATSQENLTATEKRFQAGSIAQVDVDRIRMAHLENQRLVQQAQLQLQSAKQYLSQLLGRPVGQLSISSPLWSNNLAQYVQQHQDENIKRKTWQIQQQRYQAEEHYLKALARPNPTLNVGVTQNKTVNNGTDQIFTVGVDIPLNIFSRNQHNIKINQLKTQALQQHEQHYQRYQQVNLDHLLSELKNLQQQWQHLQQVQLPLSQQVQQKMLLGFRAGKFAVTDVQQATQQLHDVRLKQIQVLRDGWQRAITVESHALGFDVDQITNRNALSNLQQSIWQNVQEKTIN